MADETITIAEAKTASLTGRLHVRVRAEYVNDDNVLDVLGAAKLPFGVNVGQIQYLWNYYRGTQPILQRVKEVRPEINNKIVENHAIEIVSFKVGYQLAEPIQYVLRNHDGTTGPLPQETNGQEAEDARSAHFAEINELNTLMFANDKASVDREIFEWLAICGLGYRMVEVSDDLGVPFKQYSLDPRSTFVIESAAYHHRPIAGVWVGLDGEGEQVWNVWTPERRIVVIGNKIISSEPHTYGDIPIIEYQLNSARMGAFEPALPLLDAVNAVESNRLDGIEQTVQSLMKFVNCDINAETFEAMLRLGAVKVTSTEQGQRADVDFIKNTLDQSQTQVTKDDLYQAIVNICGMPNRNGTKGSSSDTGAAVLLRDGWSLAESHAKGYELEFKKAERRFLRVVLEICRQAREINIDLRLRDIELAFNRRNYENLLVKVQALTGMLPQNYQIHPELAWKLSGITNDPEAAYLQSLAWTQAHPDTQTSEETSIEDPGPVAASPQIGDNAPTGASA